MAMAEQVEGGGQEHPRWRRASVKRAAACRRGSGAEAEGCGPS
jgi:hypothetical protein